MNELLAKLMPILVDAVFSSDEDARDKIRQGLLKWKEQVNDSSNKIDDAIVLPIIDKLQRIFRLDE
jgi:hypothetical protein